MNFAQQERNWERLQESLPGGPGDACLDCDEEDCTYCRSRSRRTIGEFDNWLSDDQTEYFKRGGR